MKAASTERKDYLPYPTNHVVGTVADAGRAAAAIEALLRAGFYRGDIDILHGEEDLQRLDPPGIEPGFLAQFQRTLIRTFELEEYKHLTHHIEDVRAGRFVIMVLTKQRALRTVAADILHQHGAEFVGFYGRWAWEELPPSAHMSPEQIPALFARSWSDRDSAALAALFDEDAEFVHSTGECCHGRESIRSAHASWALAGAAAAPLTAEDTRVKLLSPEVALVHARLTHGMQAAGAAAAPPAPHATVVSFVVHRAGDRWLCASAHNTDVVPAAGTAVA